MEENKSNELLHHALVKIGFSKEEVEQLPLTIKISDAMRRKDSSMKRPVYESYWHLTRKYPQKKFYKKISNFNSNLTFNE